MSIISYKKTPKYNLYIYKIMDVPKSKNVSIQISEENLEKLTNALNQLNIKYDQAIQTLSESPVPELEEFSTIKSDPSVDNLKNDILESDLENNTDEEDILDPLTSDDFDDESQPVNNNPINHPVNDDDDVNEITPDDIIDDDESNKTESDDEFDLVSDDENTFTTETKPDQIVNVFNKSDQSLVNNETNEINDTNNEMEILNTEKKIILNIGGKNFNLKEKLLTCLNINYWRLHKITKQGRISYFLDRDPYYFSKIVALIKLYGFDQEKILEHFNDYSEQLISELCFYGLIDKKFIPRPKLKLKRSVTFPSRHDEIIKIIVDDQLFETSSGILSKSPQFDTKLKMSRSKQFYLNDVDPRIFRYVLNFLRTGELYVNNADIIELLDNYGIEYEKMENKKINEHIVSHYLTHNLDAVHNQIIGCVNTLDPRANIVPHSNDMYQFFDNNYYCPNNMFSSTNNENINIITTESELSFDSNIVFNLTDSTKDLGECIEDMLLCIDIPVLKPTERAEYVDLVEYQIIENIGIFCNDGHNKKVIMQTNNDLLYIHPMIYTNKAEDYHNMTNIDDKKMKVLYENTLIDIHRIILPLFLFRDKQNHLPVRKMINKKISTQLVVKLAPLKKLFKNGIKDIPLLNICLISNFINLAPVSSVIQNNPVQDNSTKGSRTEQSKSIIQIPINDELKNRPIMYLYDKTHSVNITIQSTSNPIYDVAVIPLDKFGFIKDFFFTIVEKEDFISNRIDKFAHELIELEILCVKENPQNQQKMLTLHSKLDSILLNYYIPLKTLGHKLPNGVYYYSFSADPKCNQILGGLMGNGYVIRIKVKKMDGIIKFYANEYHREII